MTLKQVAAHRQWPGGDSWTVALLREAPADLATFLGLDFEEGLDDLDLFDLAAIECPRVGQVWFFRHRQSPHEGVEVVVDTSVSRDAALHALRKAGVTASAVEWTTEHARDPREFAIRAS